MAGETRSYTLVVQIRKTLGTSRSRVVITKIEEGLMTLGIEVVTGTVLLVFGLSFLINPGFWAETFKRMSSDPQQVFTLLMVLLICGVLMVMGHNVWVGDWRIIVTIVGWAVLLKSIVLILAPGILRASARWSDRTRVTWLRVGGFLWALAGGVVIYFSHFHRGA
jgi:hypothetical protein